MGRNVNDLVGAPIWSAIEKLHLQMFYIIICIYISQRRLSQVRRVCYCVHR